MKTPAIGLTICVVLAATCGFGQLAAVSQSKPDAVDIRTGPVYVSNNDWPDVRIVIEPRPGPGGEQTPINFSSTDLVLLEEDRPTVSPTALIHFDESKEGMAIALAIDVSGSMRGEPLEAVKQGLLEFVKQSREYDAISIATFADDVHWETSWDASQSDVQQAIANLKHRGTRTSLYDALQAALEKFDEPADGHPLPLRRRIIVISDGLDEGSRNTLDQVIAKAKKSRIQIDSIGITTRGAQYVTSLQRASEESRGVFRAALNLLQLRDHIKNGIERLLKTPVATFKVDELRPDGKLHTMGVKWKTRNVSDTLPVMLPKAAWWSIEGRLRAWQAASLGGIALAGMAGGLLLLLRTRNRGRVPPEPAVSSRSGPVRPSEPAVAHTPTQIVRSRTEAEPVSIPYRKPTVMEGMATAPAFSPVAQTAPPAPAAETKRTQLAPMFSEPGPGRPTVMLRASEGPLQGRTFPMEAAEFWIGAAENNHLRVSGDSYMSGNHCCIRFEQHVLRLYDNGATNKTYLNGEPLGEAARMVKAGDRIQTGHSIFIVEAPTA